MTFRLLIFISLWASDPLFSQNVDSLDAVYRKYYLTDLLSVSPSGQYVVLNHNNAYGKNEDELFDLKAGEGTALGKHLNYQFLGGDRLLMTHVDYSRFQNLKSGQIRDVAGTYVATPIDRSGKVVLYGHSSKELILTSKNGDVLWKAQHVKTYQMDKENDRLIYVCGDQLVIRGLENDKSRTYKLDSDIQWMSFRGDLIYCANIKASQLELYTLNVSLDKLTKQTINSPEEFEFATALNTYFEVRENEHFIFPLYLKSKLNDKKDPELKITYSNKNSRDKYLNYHLGIFNIKYGQWDYRPSAQDHLPNYKFLNDKGDFVLYDESGDVVEEQDNVVLDFKLVLDYGKSFHLLPKKRIVDGNYLWDRDTQQFIYFDHKRWMSYHIATGADHELLPLDTHGWDSPRHSGLAYVPEVNPVQIKGMSAIMLSNQFDYFIVNLKTYQIERITRGEGQQTKYRLQVSKHQYPKSSLNVKFAEVDLEKEMTFKLFNEINYESGFATYNHKKNKTNLYRQGHYKEMIPYKNGVFLTSNFALEPFKLTRVEQGKYSVVYESLKAEIKRLEGAKYQVFQYKTRYGTANAALLFPVGYDRQKKYPMVVNIYDDIKSLDILSFLSPSLGARDGFNYMHYLMSGYLVLLPDLQYDIANVKNSVTLSLENSIDAAKLIGSIDDKNLGVLGLSFGGYGTGLALTNSKYFKTGVAGVMISDLVSHALSNSGFISMPNYMRAENHQHRMGNSLFDDWNSYLENSPIHHMKNVNTPVLIWTGLKDTNISTTQSKMFFLGMKRLQKKAVLLEYTNETHTMNSAKNKLDLNIKTWQWFDYHLKNQAPADWIRPVIN